MLDKRLYHHLVTWLGQWPAGRALHVVGSERRTRPGWNGTVFPVIGVGTPTATVLSVPPSCTAAARALADQPMDAVLAGLPEAVGCPDSPARRAVFRYTLAPAPLPDAGKWVAATDPVVPQWLRQFNGEVLIVRGDDGGFLAGAGIKRHDEHGHEVAVGTEPAARGRGLARRLVAQAARRVLDEGAVPTYQHAVDNVASGRVAAAAGFADRGWTSYSLTP